MKKRRLRITTVRRDPPDLRLLAKALIALARQQQEQERAEARTEKERRHG